MSLRIGSLFSGIGGLELGLERGISNGAHTVFQVEQNAYCRAVLAKHWPDALRFDDVRTAGAAQLPACDVLCGGFPCQDVSNAGRKAGLVEGSRSGLWFEYSRIIRELRPRYVVVENVAALLALGLDAVLGELAASGYDAEWDCIPASAVGAPHQRDRIFILAYSNSPRSQGYGYGAVADYAEQPDASYGGSGALPHSTSVRQSRQGGPSMPAVQRRMAKGKQISLSMTVDGLLNPAWVEWLMGFLPEWTALLPSETPLSPKSRKSSGDE